MNKNEILQSLIKEISLQLQSALTAAQNTYNDATHEDNKAENKYESTLGKRCTFRSITASGTPKNTIKNQIMTWK